LLKILKVQNIFVSLLKLKVMSLETQVMDSMKEAMKSKDAETLGALRGIKAAFQTLNTSGKEVTEEVRMKELQRMVKQRQESAVIFKEADRAELYDKEVFEISVIEKFLPKQMSEAEVEAEVMLAITETGASSIREMGKVIGVVSKKLVGKADGKTISDIAKKLLA
jgi:hypothetical protein